MRALQPAMAVGGALALAVVLMAGLLGDGPRPAWLRHFFVGWCVLVPYWWYCEYRLFLPADAQRRRRFLDLQRLSQLVWLGGMAALAAVIWSPA